MSLRVCKPLLHAANVAPEPLTLRHDDHDPRLIERLQKEPHLAGTVCDFRVIELIWRLDDFALRTFKFQCSPFVLGEHFQDLIKIRDKDASLYGQYRNLDPSSGELSSSIERNSLLFVTILLEMRSTVC